jgi:hypothetical protein
LNDGIIFYVEKARDGDFLNLSRKKLGILMTGQFNSGTLYRKRIDDLLSRLKILHRTSNRFSNVRLVTFVFFMLLCIFLFKTGSAAVAGSALFLGLIAFISLIVLHEKVINAIKIADRMVKINRTCLARINGEWRNFSDTGEQFASAEHLYSKDLDIFGQGSLFQWINATGTFLGRKRLAEVLSNRHFDGAEAKANTGAIVELAPLLDWRQQLACHMLETDAYQKDPGPIITWLKNDTFIFASKFDRLFHRFFPIVTPAAAGLFFLFTGNPIGFSFWIPVNIIVLLFRRSAIERLLSQFETHEPAIKLYHNLLLCLEKQVFSSEKLCRKKKDLFVNNLSATKAIAQLSSRVAFSQTRKSHMVAALLNVLFFFDIQAALLLENWKRRFGPHFESWLHAVSEIEMLSSLATIHHDNPDWCFADFGPKTCLLKAENFGHPLIDAKNRICNSVELGGAGSVMIITGSNMSGKTTLLRTIGINLVLAYAGAPVCAGKLCCATDRLFTSMRITDDLQNGISTFYAELLRIRKIIDSIGEQSAIILIDEIFRGTNTRDRHEAAKAVLTHLAKQNAMTVISTHDLDLAELETLDPAHYGNFHFEDEYIDGAIHFDYILRKGRSTSSNAMFLLEMVGITEPLKKKS